MSVVGLTLEAGAYGQSAGALLLFVTNVAAILGTGTVVMGLYGVQRMVTPPPTSEQRAVNRRNAVLVIVALVVIVVVPLTASSVRIARDTSEEVDVRNVGRQWAADQGWSSSTYRPAAEA